LPSDDPFGNCRRMCNLYSVTKGQAAIAELTAAMRDNAGNLPPQPSIFPDFTAPVVRTGEDGVRELVTMRWGMPSSQKALFDAAKARAQKLEAKGKSVNFDALLKMEPDGGTTNIRNVRSQQHPLWHGSLRHRARKFQPLLRIIDSGQTRHYDDQVRTKG